MPSDDNRQCIEQAVRLLRNALAAATADEAVSQVCVCVSVHQGSLCDPKLEIARTEVQ